MKNQIFSERLFRIPDFQRGYAWGSRQLKDFWLDLELLSGDQNHYTGVLTFEDVPAESYRKWDDDVWIIESKRYQPLYVVDGQQRLTTVVILVHAILERLKEGEVINFTTADKIREKFVFETKSQSIARSYLFGYEKDNPSYEFLKVRIFGERSEEHSVVEDTIYTRNLAAAKGFFEAKIKDFSLSDLERLYTKVTQRLLFNVYAISKEIDVFVAFETMNNRGKALSHLEILKNRLIFLATKLKNSTLEERERLRRNINESWKSVYHYLGKNAQRPLSDDVFLRVHYADYFSDLLVSATDDGVPLDVEFHLEDGGYIDHLLNEIFSLRNLEPDEDGNSLLTAQAINDYSLSLKSGVETFYRLFNPGNSAGLSSGEKINLERLARLTGFRSATLLNAIYNIAASSDQRTLVMSQLERLLFMGTLWYRQAPSADTLYLDDIAVSLSAGRMTIEELAQSLANRVNRATGEIRMASLKDMARDRGFYGWRAVKYFMFEYEIFLQASSKTSRSKLLWDDFVTEHYDKDFSSVEHIYPQKARDVSWRPAFKNYTTKERSVMRHSLGNLLPLSRSKNSSLSNSSFSEKKKGVSAQSGYMHGSFSEIEVSRLEDWTPSEILKRGLRLLDFMELRWNLDLGGLEKKIGQLGLNFVVNKEPLLGASLQVGVLPIKKKK